MDEAYKFFERMKAKEVSPSQVTYGILMDGFINDNQMSEAVNTVNSMKTEGFTMNLVLYTTLIKGLVRTGDVDKALVVYEQICAEQTVTPDRITFGVLIKGCCDADRLETALDLFESMTKCNLKPDEIIFNSLLAGCCRQGNLK